MVELKPSQTHGNYFDTAALKLKEEFLKQGILIRPLGNVIYVLPPYILPPYELHRIFDLLENLLGPS